jgi:hypothetical protein|tara:strand:- start:1040 stop:1285 length:246 start_codon:yes stop_codon:yes gene_type:complete
MKKRLDTQAVWIHCPMLSKEGGKRLGADWSILSATAQKYIENEKNCRLWAEKAVREDPDSPAFYLLAMWGGRLFVKRTRPC